MCVTSRESWYLCSCRQSTVHKHFSWRKVSKRKDAFSSGGHPGNSSSDSNPSNIATSDALVRMHGLSNSFSLSLSLSNPFTSSLPQIIMPFRNAPIQLKETSDGVDITDLEGSAIGQMLEGGLKADQVVDIIQESVVSGLMRRGRCRRGRN